MVRVLAYLSESTAKPIYHQQFITDFVTAKPALPNLRTCRCLQTGRKFLRHQLERIILLFYPFPCPKINIRSSRYCLFYRSDVRTVNWRRVDLVDAITTIAQSVQFCETLRYTCAQPPALAKMGLRAFKTRIMPARIGAIVCLSYLC